VQVEFGAGEDEIGGWELLVSRCTSNLAQVMMRGGGLLVSWYTSCVEMVLAPKYPIVDWLLNSVDWLLNCLRGIQDTF